MLKNLDLIHMQIQVRLLSTYYVPRLSAAHMLFVAAFWSREYNDLHLQMRKLRFMWAIWTHVD